MCSRARRRPETVALWRGLWEHDKDVVLKACDRIVAERPVPDRLLARLKVTTRMERR